MNPPEADPYSTLSAQVSGLYGPGTFYGWELLALSCIIHEWRQKPSPLAAPSEPLGNLAPPVQHAPHRRQLLSPSTLKTTVRAAARFDADFFGVILIPTVASLDLLQRLCQHQFHIEYISRNRSLAAISSILWSNWTIMYIFRLMYEFRVRRDWKRGVATVLLRATTTLTLVPTYYMYYRETRGKGPLPARRELGHEAWYTASSILPETQLSNIDKLLGLGFLSMFALSISLPVLVYLKVLRWGLTRTIYNWSCIVYSTLITLVCCGRTIVRWIRIVERGNGWRIAMQFIFCRAPVTGHSILDLDQMVPLLAGAVSVLVRLMQVVDSYVV